jgi:hypothetical protein
MNIAIIGNGWYGCYIAEYLINNYKNVNVTIIDKNKDIFENSSYSNQNRLHIGFHYPRSRITIEKCIEAYYIFKKKYETLLEKINKNYYVISNNLKVNFNDYIKKYNSLNIKYDIIQGDFLKNTNNKFINTDEMFINFEKTKKYFTNVLKNIEFKFNYKVFKIENDKNSVIINNELHFDKVFNCTYNQIQCTENVIYEKCISLLYMKKKETFFDSLTVMDGDFFSIYKYNKKNFSLTSVKYTPLIKSKKFNDVYNFNNYNIEDKIKQFEQIVLQYFPNFKKYFKYKSFYISYKCKNVSKNDDRDLNINIDDNVFNVWCGKISLVCLLDNNIKKFINKNA